MSKTGRRFPAPLQEPAGRRHRPGCSTQALLAPSSPTNKPPTNLKQAGNNSVFGSARARLMLHNPCGIAKLVTQMANEISY
jgi:hypothetical protein